jgi:hypothetical protein
MKKFTDKINESVEDKIPTAQEFVEKFTGDDEDGYLRWDTVEHMCKEFAKLHVEAALKAASVSAEIENCGNPYDPSDDSKCVSETSILNAYPLDNIK